MEPSQTNAIYFYALQFEVRLQQVQRCVMPMHLSCRGLEAKHKCLAKDYVWVLCDECLCVLSNEGKPKEVVLPESRENERMASLEAKVDSLVDMLAPILGCASQNPSAKSAPSANSQSYASVTSRGIPSTGKIVTVADLKSVSELDEDSKRLVIANLPETGNDMREVQLLINRLDPSARVADCFRMGLIDHRTDPKVKQKTRLVKVCFSSSYVAKSVLSEAAKLRSIKGCESIYIRRSLPKSERDLLAKLRRRSWELNNEAREREEKTKFVVIADKKIICYTDCAVNSDKSLGKGTLDQTFSIHLSDFVPDVSLNGH